VSQQDQPHLDFTLTYKIQLLGF